jgi:uncharacterized RDD family membrane protein YckC
MNELIHDVKIASKTKRLIAFILDSIIIQTIIFSYVYFKDEISYWEYLDQDSNLIDILSGTIIALSYGIIYPIFSGNLGHKIIGLKVINTIDKTNFNKFYEGGFREFLKSLCTILILPCLWVFFDKKNQNIYDHIFKTIVVEKSKNT